MGIHTISLGGNNIPPPPESINIEKPQQKLISDDEIDELINSQKINKPSEINIPRPEEKQEEYYVPPQIPESNTQEETGKFDLSGMNLDLDSLKKDAIKRIKDLDIKQKKIADRINLIEKFILLDEKSLAIESARQDLNLQKISAIKKSIFSQTELISETSDILLKFEAQIQGWFKTLMDIEKDKVSAYQKIKSLNKEQSVVDGDITDVISTLNTILKNDPAKLMETANTLNIGGYSGKKFNG
jgi:hypothetical protein